MNPKHYENTYSLHVSLFVLYTTFSSHTMKEASFYFN